MSFLEERYRRPLRWLPEPSRLDESGPSDRGDRLLRRPRKSGRVIAREAGRQGRLSTLSSQTERPGSSTSPGATTVGAGGAPVAYSVETTSS
jgi:hypothetical protein